MIPFDAAHKAVHYPPDRRFRIWIRPAVTVILVLIVFIPLIFAWGRNALFGLPHIPVMSEFNEEMPSGPHGFRAWIRWSHFFNMLSRFMLSRSGLSILMDHPRV